MVASAAPAPGGGGGAASPPRDLEAALAARVASYLDTGVADGAAFLAERLVTDFPTEVRMVEGADVWREGGTRARMDEQPTRRLPLPSLLPRTTTASWPPPTCAAILPTAPGERCREWRAR